jgi:two-component system response regulator FlrC
MPYDKSILVAGEDRDLRQNLAVNIQNAGFCVLRAENAQSCLLLLGRRRVDLIILGRRMADMNEMAFLATVRRMYPELPVLFLVDGGFREPEDGPFAGAGREVPVNSVDPERILGLIHSICT